MKILIVGGAGYIGGVTAHMAAKNGHDITVFDNLSSGLEENITESMVFVKGDIIDKKQVAGLFQNRTYDVIMHFAAKILVPESMQKPEEYLAINSFGVLNVAEQAIKSGVSAYVLSSTAAVYGTPNIFPITEDAPQNPINPYGESKLIAEHILRSFQQSHQLNWVAFRYFNVAGAFDGVGPNYPFVSHVIPALLDRAYKKQTFSINGTDYDTADGTCVRDFVHAADIARAHIMAAEKMVKTNQTLCQPINLGSSNGYSVKQITDTFLSITKKEINIAYGERRPGDPDKLIAGNARAKEILGWQPEYSLEDIIETHTQWYDALPSSARVKNIIT